MKRKIIRIDEEKCTGCGLCVQACHEGAIGMVGGKARLLREDYCDGLGDCLPACPVDAISFEEREAPAYDHAAVLAAKKAAQTAPCGCPGSQPRRVGGGQEEPPAGVRPQSRLAQWPVQIRLAPVSALYFEGADLLIAADCTAYAFGDFHDRFIRGRVTLIGCPKLDEGDDSEKLAAILGGNAIASVTVVRMEVPCCGGIVRSVRTALAASGRNIPCRVVTLSVDGRVLSERDEAAD